VFNAPDLDHVGDCAYGTVDKPGSPVSLAFNSRNQMVVGNDGYYGDPAQRQLGQLWFYVDPLNKQTPDASIALYIGTPGELAFDHDDNLIVQDHTWYKVWVINLDTDAEWLEYFPGVPTRADFKASPTSGVFPLMVQFTNTSINYTSSLWSFGDSMTSTLQSPTHAYAMPGAYTVALTVSRGLTETHTLTRTNYIVVWESFRVHLPLVLRGY
jgi:PKD repeat protein